jgi:hypothetical protein
MEKTQEELKQEAEAKAAAALTAKSLEEELSLETPKVGEEDTVDSLKARLAKAEEERENYKTGLLALKKKGTGEGEGETEEVDVKAVAENAATGVIEKNNEKTAIAQFTEKYPALKEPSVWAKVVENYNSKAGKGSVDAVKQDLEAALILAKHYGGGKVAEKEISLNQFASVSQAGSIAHHESSNNLPDSTIEMGRLMGNSAEALQKASDEGNEIRLI